MTHFIAKYVYDYKCCKTRDWNFSKHERLYFPGNERKYISLQYVLIFIKWIQIPKVYKNNRIFKFSTIQLFFQNYNKMFYVNLFFIIN